MIDLLQAIPLNPRLACTKPVDLGASRVETKAATGEARVKILLYGRLADAIGREIALDRPSCTVEELRRDLGERHPGLADVLDRSRAVATNTVIGDDQFIPQNGEVEFLPPVCG